METKVGAPNHKDAIEINIEPMFDDGDFFYRVAVFDVEYHPDGASKAVKDISHHNTLQSALETVMDWYGEKNVTSQG